MYFDFEYYKGKSVAIHCKSKTQAKKWCKLMHKNGLRWWDGTCYMGYDYNHRIYESHRDQTCYDLEGTYSSIDSYKRYGFTIIEFEDIIAGKYDRRNNEAGS